MASVSQALPPWVGARGNGFYGIDPLNTSLRKYGQQALLRRLTVFNGNIGNKDQSKEENNKRKKKPVTLMTDSTSFPVASWSFSNCAFHSFPLSQSSFLKSTQTGCSAVDFLKPSDKETGTACIFYDRTHCHVTGTTTTGGCCSPDTPASRS